MLLQPYTPQIQPVWARRLPMNCRSASEVTRRAQGRSDGRGVYRYIYTPQKKQSTLQIFMWLLVVFFSLTQDKFDIVPVCALARVSFTYLHTTIYTPK